jgi:hypothetical protein
MTTDETSNTDSSGPENTSEVHSLSEARARDVVVREYVADGALYAYRDGEEHVVVSRGREPPTRWTKRVPAERTEVESGEQLWSIPDNWEQRLVVKPVDYLGYAVYRIPETDVDVKVSMPIKDRLVDAWYKVEAVGELTARYADECDWDRLDDVISEVRALNDWEQDVVDALEYVAANTDRVEAEVEAEVNRWALEVILDSRHVPSFDGWVVKPWREGWHSDHSELLQDVLADHGVSAPAREEASRVVVEENVLPLWPTVRLSVVEPEECHVE